jgi:peptide/nickel transport system ATP-binding protein
MTKRVELVDVSFRYPGHRLDTLRGVNLSLNPGEIVGLSGLSGVGKSTLADLLLGLLPPTKGQVFWKGKNRAKINRRELRRQRPEYQKVFQDPIASFPPHQTTGQALRDLISCHRLVVDLDNALEPLGLDPDVLDRYPHQLSGGEMQRLAVVRIMLVQPACIVADEPTSMLDLSVQAEVIRLLEKLVHLHNWSLCLISHDEELLKIVCTRILRLVDNSGRGASLVPLYCS